MPDVAEFPIPLEVVPEGRVCVQFTIPDNDQYRQIFLGWFIQLTYQFNWARDAGHNAVTCSNLFKQSMYEMIASLTNGCTGDDMYFRLRLDPENDRITQAQWEPDGEWFDVLNNTCCCGDGDGSQVVLHQIDPITLQLEISTDEGETWKPDPESPVNQIAIQPAPVISGVSATKCDAASNGKQHIEDLIAGCHANLETAESVFDLAVGVMTAVLTLAVAYFSGGTLATAAASLATAIWGAAHGAFELGIEAFDAYWTSDERDKILCCLYCNIGEDGSFDQAGYDGFMADWLAQATPSLAYNFVRNALKVVGLTGLNNFCSYGESADGDCSDCECACDTDLWNIWSGCGTGLVRGTDVIGNYIQANSVVDEANFGGHVVCFTTNIPEICCTLQTQTGLPSTGTWFYDQCGEPITEIGTGFPHQGLAPSAPINTIGHNSAGSESFTLRIYLKS